MCDTIAIVGGPELETPREFLEWFGYEPLPYGDVDPMTYPCFCGSDIDPTLRAHDVAFLYDGMGYVVGDVDYLRKRIEQHPDRYWSSKSYLPKK